MTSTATSPLARRVQLLMLGRVGFITVVLGATLWLGTRAEAQGWAGKQTYLLSALVVGTYALTILYAFWLRRGWGLQRLASAQVLGDVLLATCFTWATGGAESNLSFLYLLAAIGASQTVSRALALGSATLAALAFTAVSVLAFVGVLPHAPGTEPMSGGQAGQRLALLLILNILAIYAVAFLGSLLFEQARQAGERLAETRADLDALGRLHRNIVESLQSGLLTLDRDGRITFVNPAAEQLLERRFFELDRRPGADVLPGLRNIGVDRYEEEYLTPSKERRQLGLHVTPLQAGDGTTIGSVVIFTDLTALRETEKALERAERFAGLGRMAAQLAHEIRNPLTAISGAVEMLAGKADTEGNKRKLTEILRRETERLDGLLNEILDYTRPRDPVRVRTELLSLVRDATAMLERDRDLSERKLQLDLPKDAMYIDAEPDQIKQALWNLLRNAAQVTPTRGTITIMVKREDGSAVVSVSDGGPGVPDEEKGGIFEPFYTTRRGGTGIGLAVVRRIVESHGGDVSVDDGPQRGAIFRLRLPLAEPAATTTTERTAPARAGTGSAH